MGGVFTNRLGRAVCPLIFGRVLGLRDAITFQEETVAEARQAFQDSVDDYLEFCAARRGPGEVVLRLHRASSRRPRCSG